MKPKKGNQKNNQNQKIKSNKLMFKGHSLKRKAKSTKKK